MVLSLYDRINAYAASKKEKKFHPDNVKKTFFTSLAKQYLTVGNLTQALMKLNETERYQLFYLGRKSGSPEEKASSKCQAARLIQTIYRELGVPLSDSQLEIIVAHGLSQESGPGNALREQLLNYTYQYWQQNPLSSVAINHLERELKGEFKKASAHFAMQLPEDFCKSSSLITALKNTAKLFEGVLASDQSHRVYDFSMSMLWLYPKAPDYFPEIVARFFDREVEKYISPSHFSFYNQLFCFCKKEIRPEFINSLCKVNADFAAVVVRNSQDFFTLPPLMQEKVFHSLKYYTTKHQLIKGVRPDSSTESADSPLSGFNRNELYAILDNPDYRQEAAQCEKHETFNRLLQVVVQRAFKNQAAACSSLQKKPALKIIDAYLHKQPNWFKTDFFRQLREEIETQGLSVELLQKKLNRTELEKLFAKWTGARNSRAMGVMKELYQLACLTEAKVNEEQQAALVSGHLMPFPKYEANAARENFLKKQVKRLLLQPASTGNSREEQAIKKELTYYRSFSRFWQSRKLKKQKKAEAVYQKILVEKGLQWVKEQRIPAVFDTQGHILVRVTLQEEDYAAIVFAIRPEYGELLDKPDVNKQGLLEELLGTKISSTTFCNLDVAQDDYLRNQFIVAVQGDKPSEELDQILQIYMSSNERGSVIALQEELSMHVSLCWRALKRFKQEGKHDTGNSGANEHQMPEALHALNHEINQLVLTKFRTILAESYTDKRSLVINYEKINKALDEARKELAPECRKLLVKVFSETMNPGELQRFERKVSKELTDHFFTSTSATNLDYLRTDASNKTVGRISATEHTAHNKEFGKEKQALRLLLRNHYDAGTGNVVPFDQTIEARVPAIAEKKKGHTVTVRDVADKLDYSQSVLRAKAGGYKGPLIYNLLTSTYLKISDYLFIDKTKQRASAARILKGAHLHNFNQLKRGETEAFVYVQNVSVNQHGRSLNIDDFDDATAEATLMTDVALLATFNHYAWVFPPSLRDTITQTHENVQAHYLHFLPQAKDGDHYFKHSAQGQQVIFDIARQKKQWQEPIQSMFAANDLQALVVQALFKMFANNDYQKQQFGMLVQALSIYIEPLSQAGCKSANERYQAVSGRVELLKSIGRFSPDDVAAKKSKGEETERLAVFTALKEFVAGNGTVAAIQKAVDVAYNKHNLQGCAAALSEEDQGAASKVQAFATSGNNKGAIRFFEYNTNHAETGYLTRLWQKFADSMQAHKAHLAAAFKKLFKGQVMEMEKTEENNLPDSLPSLNR
ncbi:hypothetical protein [Legionella fairfieldensis]|uniref:hypothetical protein n=1 Tax=Legionella fairfieldensis TaxID=45064 RepID=UPI00049035BD|nr:hypothetical protein [Legionella fairfieldensis]